MARAVLPLNDKKIQASRSREKDYKLFDGGGLFLLVSKGGGKLWNLKYRIHNKEKKIALGAYPSVSLSSARARREELKELIAQGIDPSAERQAQRALREQTQTQTKNTFFEISQKWWRHYEDQVSEGYHLKLLRALENYLYPTLRNNPITEITRLEIIAILEDLKKREIHETARRTVTLLNMVFRYAVTHEYIPHNIMADIETREILGKKTKRHYPTFTDEQDIRGLLMSIDDYSGDFSTKMALKVLPYLFVRSQNIRHMEWKEIDWGGNKWVIPAKKMKTKEAFLLPLPDQVITLLKEIKEYSTSTQYIFPSYRADNKPLSNNTLIAGLRRMGYTKEEFVPHSFRSMFSTIAYEWANHKKGHGYTGEVIEACLAHKEPNKIKAAYNHSNYRKAMQGLMQWYADHLDRIKQGVAT